MSHVFRVICFDVRMPRSHKITSRISMRHDIFRGHQQFLDRSASSRASQHWPAPPFQRLQQNKILHVAARPCMMSAYCAINLHRDRSSLP